MKALLRFQWTVIVRTVAGSFVVFGAPIVVAGLWFAVAASDRYESRIAAGGAFCILAIFGLGGMYATLDALDVLRWTAPVGRGRALRAFLGFWLVFWVGASAIVAATVAQSAGDAVIIVTHAALFAVAAAGAMLFFLQVARSGSGGFEVLARLLVGGALVWPAGASFLLAWTGRWEALPVVAAVAALAGALGFPLFLRSDRAAAASTVAAASTSTTDVRRGPLAPTVVILRCTLGTGAVWWIAYIVMLSILVPNPVAWMWPVIGASNLARAGDSTWRWLLPTPIDRRRAFRLLVGPGVAFVVAVVAARFAVLELATDRSAFFRDPRSPSGWLDNRDRLSLQDVLYTANGRSYERPRIEPIAERVQVRLRERLGIDVPTGRISAAMARGWPTERPTGVLDFDQTTAMDAMERVHVELAPEIAGAVRRRDCADAAVAVLLFFALLRVSFLRGWRSVVGTTLVVLLPLSVVTFGRTLVGRPLDDSDVLFPNASWTVAASACAVAAVASVLLWRSSFRAFRRVEFTDIRPTKRWTAQTSA